MFEFSVIITGTDPTSRKGGIGVALPGYLRALDLKGIPWRSIPTYHPSSPGGKWQPWLRAFPKLARTFFTALRKDESVIIYSHAGAGVSMLREFFILLFARAFGVRTILQLHALEICEYLANPFKRLGFLATVSPAQELAVLTPWWRQILVTSGVAKSIFIIPNPLPEEWEERARMSRSSTLQSKKIVLLSLTRLVRGKGVDAVIEALPFLPPEFELIVAGDGPQRKALQQRVEALAIKTRVRFTGWVSGEDKQCLFDEADVFVLPSRYDSFGMGFLEAMANGMPVVAAAWGPIPDVVPHGRCGILLNEENPQALANAIMSLREAEIRQRMGEEAKRWVLEKFSAEIVGQEIAAMLDNIVN